MTWEHPGGDSLDYQFCRYGKSRLLVRGPKARLAQPYTVFLGGTETFGRFVERPFAEQAGAATGLNTVNISCLNAGLDAFAEDPALLAVTAGADTTVIQVLGAANLTNDFYTVHPRRNDRFLRPTAALAALYPEVDFTEFSFTRHLLQTLEERCAHRFATVVDTLKARWRVQMHRLIAEARGRVVLLWIANQPPPHRATAITGAADPLFIDHDLMVELGARADRVLEVIPSYAARAAGTEGMIFNDFEAHIAAETINGAVHAQIAEALAPILRDKQRAA